MESNIQYSFVSYVRVRSSPIEAHASRRKDSNKFEVERFTFLPKMIFERHDEYMYLKLVDEIISSGTQKDDRTGTGTLSKFGCQVAWYSDYLCIFVFFIFVILAILFILQLWLTDKHFCLHLSNTCTLCRCVSIFVDLFHL